MNEWIIKWNFSPLSDSAGVIWVSSSNNADVSHLTHTCLTEFCSFSVIKIQFFIIFGQT